MKAGTAPITKNIRVTNMNGELIGYTYPKRVKGLVKHGRAEIVDDTEIRLLDLSPAENNLDFSEERNMNILNFNPSDFRINPQCRNSSYSKEVITDDFLNNLSTYKIGDWKWSWCQIDSDAKLEKNTDYLFRFAVAGGYNNTFDAVSRFIITKNSGIEDDYTGYNLAKSAYKPVLSKSTNIEHGWLRVFEVQFNTGDCDSFTFSFAVMHAEARIMPALDNEAYASLPDMDYAQLCEKIKADISKMHSNNSARKVNIDLSGAVIREETLQEIMQKFDALRGDDETGDINFNLSGTVIDD